MTQRAVVLGSGMVGSVMAADLAADDNLEVTIADRNAASLARVSKRCGGRARTAEADLSDADAVRAIIADADIVLGALASAIGLQTLQTVIEAGKAYCDISFMPEDAWELDELAKANGVTAIVDCGVAPGMSHVFAGYGAMQFDQCERIDICVGGLPVKPQWPFQYKAGFSPADVIEEYTRPARIVEGGRIVTREALSEPELLNLPGVGTLEAFNTDGLRSLAHTLDVPYMRERTLRYPGHRELMHIFRETGLFSHEPLEVGDVHVRPIDVISALMFPMWTFEEGEADLTVMRVVVEGVKDGKRRRITWDLLDHYDETTHTTSMARTTAFPCTILARRILSGAITEPGVIVPERIGQIPGELDHLLHELNKRGVCFDRNEETID